MSTVNYAGWTIRSRPFGRWH